jgi:hypothetical protein
MKHYSIHTEDGEPIIEERLTRQEAISAATERLRDLAEETGAYGFGSAEALLVAYEPKTDHTENENIKLGWFAERGIDEAAEYGTWNKADSGVV